MERIYLKSRKILAISAFASGIFLLSGCHDFFNPDTESTLSSSDYITNSSELYSGFLGITSSVQAVADQSIYLEGLRGDLLEPTDNAPENIRNIYNYTDIVNGTTLNGNSLADPKGYYTIILNCNDFIKKATDFRSKNSTAISDASFNGLISGTIRYKTWAYMMLAKIYGEAIWIDDPLTSYADISNYPVLAFDDVINKCIDYMENGVNGITGKVTLDLSSSLFPGSTTETTTQEWNRVCPLYQILLEELYLWNGNYTKVVDNAINLLTQSGVNGDFLLNKGTEFSKWVALSYSFNRDENIFISLYDYTKNQNNHLVTYFSNYFPNNYYMRPTQVAMDRFNNQVQTSGTLGDPYRGKGYTFTSVNGQWVLTKYTRNNATSSTVYKSDNMISLYRASDIYLFLIEALANLGRFQEAYVLLNGGIEGFLNSTGSFNHPFESYPTSLASDPTSTSWGANQGIRGRPDPSVLKAVGDSLYTTTKTAFQQKWDSILVEEAGLESAGESRAYYAMIRTSKRWGDTKRAMWAAKVTAKYSDGSAIYTKLAADINNWFIKYKLK